MSEKEKKCNCGCGENEKECTCGEHEHDCDCGCEDIVELTTEDGKKLKFYFIKTIEYKGKYYSAFEPAEEIDGIEEDDLIIFELSGDDEETADLLLLKKIEENISQLVKASVEKLGYELYDVEYVKEGKDYYLRVYIEGKNGISLDDCEKVSNEITDILDKEVYIKEQYFLEVSSTGIEKVLKKDKHLEANIGVEIQVKLFKPVNKNKQYQGILKGFNENEIILETEEEFRLERKNISQIKTIYHWEE